MISFSFDAKTKSVSIDSVLDKELNINDDEKTLVEMVLSFITPPKNPKNISIERRSNNYITMFYKNNDFLRFKYTERAKWISLDLPPELRDADNPLFAAQAKKTQRHWRADLDSLDDLNLLKDFIVASCCDFFEENPLYKLNMKQLDEFAKSNGYHLTGKTKTEKINSLLVLTPNKE